LRVTTESVQDLPSMAEARAPIDLDRVYREHAAQVSRWVRRLSGPGDPSDTLQEVFEVAQRRLPSFRGDSQITTWLYAITVRVVSSRRRKARLRRLLFLNFTAEPSATEPVETPQDNLDRQRASNVVYGVLDRLSERDRTLLILFELERLSSQEISDILQISSNNVAVGLHRARARFRALLRKHFPEEAEGMDDGQSTP
jgi:RNA polymerase sigma-70 factor (ECF subfamily)